MTKAFAGRKNWSFFLNFQDAPVTKSVWDVPKNHPKLILLLERLKIILSLNIAYLRSKEKEKENGNAMSAYNVHPVTSYLFIHKKIKIL